MRKVTILGDDVEELEAGTVLVGMQDGAASTENNIAVLQKIRNRVPV